MSAKMYPCKNPHCSNQNHRVKICPKLSSKKTKPSPKKPTAKKHTEHATKISISSPVEEVLSTGVDIVSNLDNKSKKMVAGAAIGAMGGIFLSFLMTDKNDED
jgi:hypothetical protein